MDANHLGDAIASLEKANANLQPELLTSADARTLLAEYSRVQKLATFGIAALARKIDDTAEVAKATGTSMGTAKDTIATGKTAAESGELDHAMRTGTVSLVQAAEIAKAEVSCPGIAKALLPIAESAPFHVLKERSRKARLEAEQHRDLPERQHAARSGRSYTDDLGMVHVHLALEPHVGAPIVARAEGDAQRLASVAKKNAPDNRTPEPFECYLADSYAGMLSGAGEGRAKRPDLAILVSHEIARRGWKDVKDGEMCKIPGLGPVAPKVAKKIAQDAFLSGVFYDGKDLRHLKRWTRHIPIEVLIALELGKPPDFDGIKCSGCGTRFKNEIDHVVPRHKRGPTSHTNLDPKCHRCHKEKSERERQQRNSRSP